MRLLLILLLFAFAACSSLPRSTHFEADQLAVLESVQALFDVLETKDAEAGARAALANSTFVSVDGEGDEQRLGSFTYSQWLAGISTQTSHLREYFVGEPVVLIEGDVAVVWGRYVLEIDGEVSHRGVDAFNLVRTPAGWKIVGGAYSMLR